MTSDDIAIRVATPQDEAAILAVEREAFGENEEAELVDALVAGEAFVPELSLVAVVDDLIVDHILFTRARAGGVDAVLFAPLAVSPDCQGCGIGGVLVCAGLARAAELGFGIALVLGRPAYYPRFGAVRASLRGLLAEHLW